MTRKLTYEYVKKYIESQGYKLLSTSYINAHTKLKVMCPHGHVYEVIFNNFQRGRRCKKCSGNKKLTQEYIEKELSKEGYRLIGKYVNSKTKMTIQDEEGYLYIIIWANFQQGQEPDMVNPSNPYSLQNIQHYLDLNVTGYKILSTEYTDCYTDLKFKCDKGHICYISWANLKHNQNRCDVCTCVAVTHPWILKFLKNKEDGYTHTYGSGDKVHVVCPNCGKEKKMTIKNICKNKDISCTCGDNISYPNKFVYNAMMQVFGVDNVFTEYKFDWSDNKIYDILVKTQNGNNVLIENHGVQHYKEVNRGRTLQEEQQNDIYKKELAEQNRFIYIELDCSKSELEYIKNSILNSELNNILDLSKINWLQCEEFALSNIVKKVCDYWHLHNDVNNENLTTLDISKIFNLNQITILKYLKQGTKLNWCNYNGKFEQRKGSIKSGKLKGKAVEIFKDEKSLGIFPSCAELERQSEELFGVKLLNSSISQVCNGKKQQYKGFTFKYINQESEEI